MAAITQVDMTESDSEQSSTLKTNRENSLLSFPAASEDHRYLRKRAAILCAAFNSLPIDAPDVDRARAWHDIVSPKTNYDGSDVAMIKAPIQIDYGLNVRIHPSCFINRDCFIADSPDCMVSIGEHTVIGVSARILGVTHPIDWRERKGRQGPRVAGDVVIGKNCFIGANVIVLPGITIEDGCVIGAGSVVTKNIPAYHVAAGNPARVIRKVAPDVPDSPDLLSESDGGRSKVRRPKTNTEHGHDRQSLGKTRRQQAARQNPPDAGSFMANLVRESKEHRATLLTAGLLVVVGMVGFWLGGHPMA